MERVPEVVGQIDVHPGLRCPQQLQCYHLDSSDASRQRNFLNFGVRTQGVAQSIQPGADHLLRSLLKG